MTMTRVFERIYLGDADDTDRLVITNPSCIIAVVNVNTEGNQQKCEGIKYVHFPLDEYEWILPRRFERIITAISQLVRGGNVLVQCGGGISRSPVVVGLYMHVVGYKTFHDALSEVRILRPVVAPSALIIQRAKAYLEEMI